MSDIEHTLWITKMVNKAIGGPAETILKKLHLVGENFVPKNVDGVDIVIPDHTVQAYMILIVLGFLAWRWGRNLKVVPTGVQHIVELFAEIIQGLLKDVIGPKGPKYFGLIATLAIFIFLSNLAGIVPGLMSPTNNLNTTVACALIVFIYYHFQGIKEQGLVKYFKHFAGPVWWLAPVMVPIELIGHFARPLSLSIRLFGNIMGEDIVIIILFILAPWFVPIPMLLLAIFTSLLQAFIFVMLSMMYIAGAVAAEEH